MKIGILTFHDSHNCGSMLQAFALQKILSDKYGCDVEIIDFSNKAQQNMYAPIPKPHNWKQVIKAMIWLTNYRQLKKQYIGYIEFQKKYFILSEVEYETLDELKTIEGKYDKLITGSDQVWNIMCTDADDAYYLNFVENAKKYAYAVSFGAHNVFKLCQTDYYKNLIESMDYVSVRENNAQKWIKQAIGQTVPICLDPTMLLSEKQWTKYIDIGEKSVIKGKYIFYYCFGISQPIARFLRKISKKTGLPVYFFEAKEWTLKCCWVNGIKLVKEYGPDVFLNVMKHAKIVITTSFHGTAFSTIFQKNFWYIDDGNNDPEKDDRALSFLRQLKLMSRYLTTEELLEQNLYEHPNYVVVEEALSDLKKESLQFIEKIVED